MRYDKFTPQQMPENLIFDIFNGETQRFLQGEKRI